MAEQISTVDQRAESWWSRQAGGREVIVVALPLVISSLSWTVMTFIDRMFLFWVSGSAMAAGFFASVVWFGLFSLPLGVSTYANTFVSQYFGDKQYERIGPSVWQTVWLAALSIPLIAIAIPLAPTIFDIANHGGETMQMEIKYFQILCFGGPGMVAAQALSAFYSGRGETWVVMIVDAAVALVNLVLDYLWIFGYWGFPEMGIEGAGWATVTAFWIKTVIYLVLLMKPHHRLKFNTLGGLKLEPGLFGRIFYYGIPSGMQMFLDVLGFTIFVMLVGSLGDLEAEATTLAFSIATLAFMPIFGFSIAGSVLVGQHIGENRADLAARSTWTTLQITTSYLAVLSLLYIFTPGLFLNGFLSDSEKSGVDQDALRTMASNLLCFVAAYNLFDAMQHVFSAALKGAGDTRFIMKVSLVMAITLALVSWLSIEVFEAGIYASWTVITGWVWVLGIAYFVRYIQGKWRKMRVIESHETTAVVTAEVPEVPELA